MMFVTQFDNLWDRIIYKHLFLFAIYILFLFCLVMDLSISDIHNCTVSKSIPFESERRGYEVASCSPTIFIVLIM